jgi:Tfp pilus assembly protein PilW
MTGKNSRHRLGAQDARRRRQAGFSLIETAIAAVTFSIIFLAIMIVFDSNQANFARETTKVDVHQNVRVGLDDFNRDLRLAGYGVPSATKRGNQTPVALLPIFCNPCPAVAPFPACGSLGSMSPNTVAFMADMENASTTVSAQLSTTNQLQVTSVARLAVNDAIFITDGDTWDAATITSIDAPNQTITFTPSITKVHTDALPPATYRTGTFVGRPRCIRYQVGTDPATGRTVLQRDAADGRGWQTIADNAQSLALTYYDVVNQAIAGSSTANIRRIRANINGTATPPGLSSQSFQLTGDTQSRNMR